jgi:hypothetical protein
VKPTEFGKLVKIQEAEAQFITDYEVCETRVPDQALWVPSLIRHEQLFGRAPRPPSGLDPYTTGGSAAPTATNLLSARLTGGPRSPKISVSVDRAVERWLATVIGIHRASIPRGLRADG